MKICVWKAADDVPTSHFWLARFLTKGGFTPVFVTAKTEDEVRRKAQEFWDAEVARLQKGGKPRGKPDPGEKGESPSPDDDIHMIDGYGPMTTAEVAELQAEFDTPTTNDDLGDLLG